jgi:hypothetical protein
LYQNITRPDEAHAEPVCLLKPFQNKGFRSVTFPLALRRFAQGVHVCFDAAALA